MSDNGAAGRIQDELIESMKERFIETATEKINDLDDMIGSLRTDDAEHAALMRSFRGEVHSLKGAGGTFGFPFVSVVCHRLEQFIEADRSYSKAELDGVQLFVDELRGIIEGHEDPDEDTSEKILATLPKPFGEKPSVQTTKELLIVLASPMAAIRQMAEFFLAEEGCQVLSTGSSLDAFRLAVENRPDMLISSIQMETIGGLDLARAVSAVSFLQNTRISLMTSSSDAGEVRSGIPKQFATIRTDQMEEDLANAVAAVIGSSPSRKPSVG